MDDGVQSGRFWKVDLYFYPNDDGDYCVENDSYPLWMADPTNKDDYLFSDATGCCERWFASEVSECVASTNAAPVEGEEVVKRQWYPTLAYPFECKSDIENIPSWMLMPGYKGELDCLFSALVFALLREASHVAPPVRVLRVRLETRLL